VPCTDVTEIMELRLDLEDRVIDYSLSKQTCGGSVAGRGLIREWVKGRSADEILTLTPARLLTESENPDSTWEYLRLKHLFSIQSVLREYGGQGVSDESGRFVEILSLDHGPEGTRLTARLKVDIITDQIRACGLCGC